MYRINSVHLSFLQKSVFVKHTILATEIFTKAFFLVELSSSDNSSFLKKKRIYLLLCASCMTTIIIILTIVDR